MTSVINNRKNSLQGPPASTPGSPMKITWSLALLLKPFLRYLNVSSYIPSNKHLSDYLFRNGLFVTKSSASLSKEVSLEQVALGLGSLICEKTDVTAVTRAV